MNICSLCEKIYFNGEKFHIYLCYDCHNKTSFCLGCDKIMSKIFNYMNIFKCEHCKKVTPAISKQLAERENFIDTNKNNNISALKNNLNSLNLNENKLSINNNFNFNSPNENKIIYPLVGNKITINTPSSYSSFFMDLKNIYTPEKKNENNIEDNISNNNNKENNILNNSDMNDKYQINKSFHLSNNKNKLELFEDKKKNIFLQLNKDKKVDKFENEKQFINKNEFSGYLKNK